MKIHVKKKDRGSVIIPCIIRDRKFKKALIDLGGNVSLMPLSIYRKLGIGTVQDTRMILQFTDHSVNRPYGIVEDFFGKNRQVCVLLPTLLFLRCLKMKRSL